MINLENTVFDVSAMAGNAPTTATWKKGELQTCPDFGTIFVGLDKVTHPQAREEILDAAVAQGPVFTAPETWGWNHIAKAIGAFPSATVARKNGWSGKPEEGFNFRPVRLNKVRGEILVVHITENSPWITDFSEEEPSKND